jgi:hypothetical protein
MSSTLFYVRKGKIPSITRESNPAPLGLQSATLTTTPFRPLTQIHASGQLTDANRVIEKLNADMSNIWHWSQENDLSLNPQKSQAIVIIAGELKELRFSFEKTTVVTIFACHQNKVIFGLFCCVR